jgi:tol-pal system protein YbgF
MKGVPVFVLSLGCSVILSMTDALADAPIISQLPQGSSGNTASFTLEQRLQLLENKVQYYERSDVVLEMQHLREQVQTLQGQLEENAHSLQQLTRQQTEFYNDFDRRLAALNKSSNAASSTEIANNKPDKLQTTTAQPLTKIESVAPLAQAAPSSKTAASAVATPATSRITEHFSQPIAQIPLPATKPVVSYLPPSMPIMQPESKPAVSYATPPVANKPFSEANAQKDYDAAFRLIGQRKYPEAQQAMANFVTNYSQSRFAANAHYWLGELYLKNGDRNQAFAHFQTIKTTFAAHPKSADARYKLGMLKKVDGDASAAKAEFNAVVANYPGTAAAQLASVQLRQLA